MGTSQFDNEDHEHKASSKLSVVFWLARPFVYPYHGHETITVVSGDELEVNIEVGASVTDSLSRVIACHA